MTEVIEPRLGPGYDAERPGMLAATGRAQAARRVDVGGLFAVVFHDAATLTAALAESLRARRVGDSAVVAAETTAAAALAPGPDDLAALLLLDTADPAALADRVEALGTAAPAVHLEVAGRRVTAPAGPAAAAMPLVFRLSAADRSALRAGATVAVVVEHPTGSARADLTREQRDAVAALAGA